METQWRKQRGFIHGFDWAKPSEKTEKEMLLLCWCRSGLLGWAYCLFPAQAYDESLPKTHKWRPKHGKSTHTKFADANFRGRLAAVTATCRYLLTITGTCPLQNSQNPFLCCVHDLPPRTPRARRRSASFRWSAVSLSAARLGLLLLMFSENFCHQKEH